MELDITTLAYVKRYSIANQPDNTEFDTSLGLLYGSEKDYGYGAVDITVHFFNGMTVTLRQLYSVTPLVSGPVDNGTNAIIAAMLSFLHYTSVDYRNDSLAYANFIVAVRTLIQ